ncbi:MAG: tetratricopeptide repeat protein [Thermoanaerobaculia bacterium]
MYCQVCGSHNPDEQDLCFNCHQKLLVLSGPTAVVEEGGTFDEESEDEGFSLDEHLLERISILEEAVKHTADTTRQLLGAVHKLERSILINQTGLAALRELMEEKRLLGRDEWSDLWQSKMEYQLLALEKRERFVGLKERIAGLYKGDKREVFSRLLDDAEYALFAFDIERALKALEAALKIDRDTYELCYFIGETYFNEGQLDQALEHFSRVLEVEPEHYEGLVYSGVIHHESGESAQAQQLLEKAVALYPDSFLPLFSLGAVCSSHGDLTMAAMLLERAVDSDPVPQALFLLGSCLYELGRLTPAIRHLQQVVRQDPAYEEAHYLLGLAYLDRRWNRKALDAFKQAERLNPNRMRYQDLVRYLSGQDSSPLPGVKTVARKWLGRAEERLMRDQPERSLECFRRAIELDPDNPTVLMSYAVACLQLNRSHETKKLARQVLALEPSDILRATACATLIEALRSEGRYREGNRVGQQLLDEGTSNFSRTIAYYEMAYNMAELEEDLDRALDYARLSLDLAPDELRQFPLAALGWVHYKRKEFDQAIDCLTRSTELEPTATTLTHLGMALLASGADKGARKVLAEARRMGGPGISVEQKMMECLKDSSRLLERVQQRQNKK